MALKDDIPALINHVDRNRSLLNHNTKLFEIYEGDLLSHVETALQGQLSPNSYNIMKHRIAPINVLKRIIQKLSKIYSQPPVRVPVEENNTDMELIQFYERSTNINAMMGDSNEFFNLFKNSAIEPFVFKGKPALRVIPSDRFLVWSNDKINPQNMTHFIKFIGRGVKFDGDESRSVDQFFIFTDDEFVAVDSEGDLIREFMIDNPDMVNPFGKIPFIYVNRSRHNLVPLPDTDTLRMSTLFPVLLSDLNYAVQFQAFSIMFGIDIDSTNLQMSPNAFWDFKSDPSNPNARPELGSLKPSVDIDQVLGLIQTTLAFWLESRNLKPSAIGKLGQDNFASGIAQIISSIDATDDKRQQIEFFKDSEKELWQLIARHMHPVWISQGILESEKRQFSPDFQLGIKFVDPKPNVSRSEVIAEQKMLLDAGLTTKIMALSEVHPDNENLEELADEIDNELNPFRGNDAEK